MKELSRRNLMIVAAGCTTAPLWTRRLSAAELRVDLSNERVGQPPTTFQPIVGTWRVVQDGTDKIIMVDGQPWKANQSNRTALLAERARSFYNASQEDFIDNVKQFAYYPIATLNGVDNFFKRCDQHEVQDYCGRSRPLLGNPVQRQTQWRLSFHTL
jgi:hypothetical protein